MRAFLFLIFLLIFLSCEEIKDVTRIKGPCTIQMVDGTTISTEKSIEILESTGTIIYVDQVDKIWSIEADEYLTYTCEN